MPVIRISESLYQRLSAHAEGFDSPASVIERLLDQIEGVDPKPASDHEATLMTRPELHFHPSEELFRKGLIEGKTGLVVLHFKDGTQVEKQWQSSRFTDSSNLRGNIWSGLLRNWEEKEIVAADFSME